jgi:ribosomal protein S18 acetylase RimI-like enzyme
MSTQGYRIIEATEPTIEVVEGLDRLIPQLSSTVRGVAHKTAAAVAGSPTTHLLVACDGDGLVVGTLSLVVFHVPTGTRALIYDVVVDGQARGHGVGTALTEAAIDLARARGARTVDLTSNPDRHAANRMYEKLGFSRRETNVFRRVLGD